MSAPVSVVIVDDHRLFREGLAALLATDNRIRVAGLGTSGIEAIRLATTHSPDVILLDVEMPGHDVSTTLRELAAHSPETKMLILTMHAEPQLMRRLIERGASGYLMKDMEIEELITTVISAGRNRDDFVTLRVPRAIVRQASAVPEPAILSQRETEILALVARARSNQQIGTALFITEGTVKRHLANVFQKLGAVSRLDAVTRATARGLIPPTAPPTN